MKSSIFNYKIVRYLLVALAALAVSSCQPEEVEIRDKGGLPLISVINDIESGGRFTILYEALRSQQMVPIYNGSGPRYDYTLFAPTNTAFQNFLAANDNYNSLGDIPDDVLREILEYHFVPGTVTSSELGSSQTTVQGEAITFAGTVINGTANIIAADRQARNGVVHEIDAILVPSTVPTQSIAETAVAAGFNSLVAAVSRFPDLLDAVDGGNGVFTVFAPTDAAFASALSALNYASLDDVPDPLLRTILEYHVFPGRLPSSEIAGPFTTLGGEDLDLDLSVVSTPDVGTSNGIIHIVSEVLVPPSLGTLVGEVLTNADFSTLAAAIVEVDLVPALAADGPFTVFAPNNQAFTDAGITDLGAFSRDELINILTYHVVGGAALESGDLVNSFPQALNGDHLAVNVDAGVTVDMATVIAADLTYPNGVVHVVNAVLLPPSDDIVDIAIASDPEFTTLVAALQKAELVETLQGDGPFTVFAPTNAAFEALFTTLGVTGIDDLSAEDLEPILLYHVVSGSVFSTDLPSGEVRAVSDAAMFFDGTTVTTSSNQDIDLTATSMLDIRATNGVIHVVNQVLVPATN